MIILIKNDFDENNEENKNERKKSPAKLILIFIIVFVLVFCGVYFGIQLYNNSISKPSPTTTSSTTKRIASSDSLVENPIDFKSLKAQNDEIYAWIKIDDTNVDHPIVQNATNDEFYLKHKAEDKSWSASGAIYTELINHKNFNDAFTVIYGHNGYGDTMFTTLHKFEDKEFFDAHPYFCLLYTSPSPRD